MMLQQVLWLPVRVKLLVTNGGLVVYSKYAGEILVMKKEVRIGIGIGIGIAVDGGKWTTETAEMEEGMIIGNDPEVVARIAPNVEVDVRVVIWNIIDSIPEVNGAVVTIGEI